MQNRLLYLNFSTLMAHRLDIVAQAKGQWLLFILRGSPKATIKTAFGLFHRLGPKFFYASNGSVRDKSGIHAKSWVL